MLVRSIDKVKTISWGNGLSRRFLLAVRRARLLVDGHAGPGRHEVAAAVPATTSRPATASTARAGCTTRDGTKHRLEPGVMYALEQHDAHVLEADPEGDMRLVCVFSPALRGDEVHELDGDGHSAYARRQLGSPPELPCRPTRDRRGLQEEIAGVCERLERGRPPARRPRPVLRGQVGARARERGPRPAVRGRLRRPRRGPAHDDARARGPRPAAATTAGWASRSRPSSSAPASRSSARAPRSSRQRYLPRIVAGSAIGAHAITEPSGGSDALAMSTTRGRPRRPLRARRDQGLHHPRPGRRRVRRLRQDASPRAARWGSPRSSWTATRPGCARASRSASSA